MAESLPATYRDLERRFNVVEDESFARLVVPNGNSSKPFHRWFHLKEAFSIDLLPSVLNRWRGGHGGEVFLDPFSGVGTSALCASEHQMNGASLFARAYGVEANPFLHFVASTKLAARQLGAPDLRELAHEAARKAQSDAIEPYPTPGLSSFSNSAFFRPDDLRQLLQLRAAIEAAGAPAVTVAVANLCLAASLEPVSGLRRDGRALRYQPKKTRVDPIADFLGRVEIAADDIAHRPCGGPASIVLGDGRRPKDNLPAGTHVSVALFSPPYLNNIDYTEVYKLEGWFLGYYANQEAFKRQRLASLRSHPSVRFPETYGASSNGHKHEFDELLEPLLASIPDNRYRVWRGPLFRGYFDDMLETLVSLRALSQPGSLAVYVVGNSLHGSNGSHFLVAADLMIARLSQLAGFEVLEVVVGRRPNRKGVGSELLRESVVALTPAVA